ncbi:glycosyltransferase [Enterococcus pseudoavium]|uniref:glycosyltransferase n=1 Tax=Enterococcus pseudoavium TaxID=44007 RepID=UPI00082CAA5B|nr:glycosyltransferase [Enterococcus pseudoavium]REC32403.1 glycosyl transferase family 1 [Enterococcus pseudoavium]
MKILHYFLGVPPARSGGLVEYTLNIAIEQSKQRDEVILLYPGEMNYLKNEPKIKKVKNVKGLETYELINSLPLALFGGIKSPDHFMKSVSPELYYQFLMDINPDIIHVHTLMGIHYEFFQVANQLEISLIFTSHDYYGLSPVPDFYHNGKSYDSDNSNEFWIQVSANALNTQKLRVFQWKAYPTIRKFSKKLERFFKIQSKSRELKIPMIESSTLEKKIIELRKYYQKIFSCIDFFHFNSSVAKKVYLNNLPMTIRYQVIPIAISEIHIEDEKIQMKNEKYRIAYIGPEKEFKGFYDFVEMSRLLQNTKYEFHTYGYVPTKKYPNLIQHGRYNREEIENIYRNIDILVVPSRWKETFGLVVLEALLFKKEVLVSKNVGSKDLLPRDHIFTNTQRLIQRLEKIQSEERKEIDYDSLPSISSHITELRRLYQKLIK